jgi:hypothetical protein
MVTTGINLANASLDAPAVSAVQGLENEIDGWPKSGNPFIKHEMPIGQPISPLLIVFG